MKTCVDFKPERVAGAGYLLMEMLVYISVVFIVLGVGYAALYKCMDNSAALRRGAADIAAALSAGERWRADLRGTTATPMLEATSEETVLRLPGPHGEVVYRFATNGVFRSADGGAWSCLLANVRSSEVSAEVRESVTAWRWELELQPRQTKFGNLRPLFTFLAVPAQPVSK